MFDKVLEVGEVCHNLVTVAALQKLLVSAVPLVNGSSVDCHFYSAALSVYLLQSFVLLVLNLLEFLESEDCP